MEGSVLPVISETKLLGTIISDDLKWDTNTAAIVKKANIRLLLLRKSAEYTKNKEDLKTIYIAYIRSLLEQSSVIWHNSLSQDNITDLERVQKNSFRIIMGKDYGDYKKTLSYPNLETLDERKKHLALKFAINCKNNERTKKLFPLRRKEHTMKSRKKEKS